MKYFVILLLRILSFFNTSPGLHTVIFTSGCTAALKLLAESFNWTINSKSILTNNDKLDIKNHLELSQNLEGRRREKGLTKGTRDDHDLGAFKADSDEPGPINKEPGNCKVNQSVFCYLQDNHTSVVGMRELALEKGAKIKCLCVGDAYRLFSSFDKGAASSNDRTHRDLAGHSESDGLNIPNLFAFPAQSNYSGNKYPFSSWINSIKHGHFNSLIDSNGTWYVVLDAAAFVSTSPLDLSVCQADFVAISFYKIFGFPTGIGALIVKSDAVGCLKKRYFGGGAVSAYSAKERFHARRELLHEW